MHHCSSYFLLFSPIKIFFLSVSFYRKIQLSQDFICITGVCLVPRTKNQVKEGSVVIGCVKWRNLSFPFTVSTWHEWSNYRICRHWCKRRKNRSGHICIPTTRSQRASTGENWEAGLHTDPRYLQNKNLLDELVLNQHKTFWKWCCDHREELIGNSHSRRKALSPHSDEVGGNRLMLPHNQLRYHKPRNRKQLLQEQRCQPNKEAWCSCWNTTILATWKNIEK